MYCTDRFLLSIITVCDVQEIPLFTFVEDQSLITGRISSQILTRTGSSDERQVWLRPAALEDPAHSFAHNYASSMLELDVVCGCLCGCLSAWIKKNSV